MPTGWLLAGYFSSQSEMTALLPSTKVRRPSPHTVGSVLQTFASRTPTKSTNTSQNRTISGALETRSQSTTRHRGLASVGWPPMRFTANNVTRQCTTTHGTQRHACSKPGSVSRARRANCQRLRHCSPTATPGGCRSNFPLCQGYAFGCLSPSRVDDCCRFGSSVLDKYMYVCWWQSSKQNPPISSQQAAP